MIYVSSSCVKEKYISNSVERIAKLGFNNIELSGGTQPQENMVGLLLELKEKYALNYLLHNYFPPPIIPFVINLAAVDDETANSTMANLHQSLTVSQKLGANKFGFHAGFLINIPTNQMGKEISKQILFNYSDALNLFCSRFEQLQLEAGKMDLYLENNVLSETNFRNFDKVNPFFFTDLDNYHELAERIKFKPLLDVAHLKVSCHTLNLNFEKQLSAFCQLSDYIHISDNDGLQDSNQPINKNSELFDLLSQNELANKTITLEVYTGEKDIIKSFQNVEELLK